MTSSARKLFFWSMVLILIMACAPSALTPVPPLDSNAINTMIVLTAEAASTQTQAAIPPTWTATATLRSTFTPVPTYTNVPNIIFPTATPNRSVQYFRVKHDSQLAQYDYKSRTAPKDWHGFDEFTPETVPLFVAPRDGTGTNRTILGRAWELYMDALNDNDQKKIRYLKLDNSGLFNGSGFPKLESLTMGGNVITIAEIQGNMGRVNTMDHDHPGYYSDFTYMTRPDLVHKFVVVAWDKKNEITYWVNTPKGSVYWPLVSDKDVWIPMDRVEPFPSLPRIVTANTDQALKKEPSSDGENTGTRLPKGEFVRIVEYYPSGPNVWGRVSTGGWVALLLNREYLTDWSMATAPPP